jgi:hypothetical protein
VCSSDLIIDLAVIDPEFKIMQCEVPEGVGNQCLEDGWNIRSNIIANSPSTDSYKFYVSMDTDDGVKTGMATLTINKPSIAVRNCIHCDNGNEWCTSGLGISCCFTGMDICDKCNLGTFCIGYSVRNCAKSCNPQSCWMDNGIPPDNECADYSNVCCISGKDYYSNGPGETHNCNVFNVYNDERDKNTCQAQAGCTWCGCAYILGGSECDPNEPKSTCTDSFESWWGCMGDYRSLNVPCLSPDQFTDDTQNDYFTWTNVDNARNVLVKDGRVANINQYGQLTIKISDVGRPVYGVKVIAKKHYSCTPDCSAGNYECSFFVWLYNSTGLVYKSPQQCTNGGLSEFNFIPSDGVWKNVTTIVLDDLLEVDYVGLLTKGGIPYCTDGSGDYNRIAEDGKICYWDVNCPETGSGWTGKQSIEIGPIKGLDPGFDCNKGGTCGKGYLEFCRSGRSGEGWGVDKCDGSQDKKICFYNLDCKTGGWSGNHKVCDSPLAECNPLTGC